MNFKALAIGTLAAVALLFGSATLASPISAPTAAAAEQTITLKPGQVYDTTGLATILAGGYAIAIDFNRYIHAMQPGLAKVNVYKNGTNTVYNVLVTE